MIINSVSLLAAPGKAPEAIAHFHAIAKEAKKLTGNEARIHAALADETGRLLYAVSYDSVKTWDEGRAKVGASTAIQKLIAEGAKAGLFLAGHTTTSLWEQV